MPQPPAQTLVQSIIPHQQHQPIQTDQSSRIQAPQVIQHQVQLPNFGQLPIPQSIPSADPQQSINPHQPLQPLVYQHPTYANVPQLQPVMYHAPPLVAIAQFHGIEC